jgi:hypothetical protein
MHTGIYCDLGSTIDIPTAVGTAQPYVLAAPAPQVTFIDLLVNAVVESLGNLDVTYCAVDPSAAASSAAATSASCQAASAPPASAA